eukprot:UN00181
MLPADKFEFTFQKQNQQGSCFRFCQFLTKYLEEQGVKFYYNSKALIFERDDYKIIALQTDNGRLTADAFVVTAGAHSLKFGRLEGVGMLVKTYSYIFDITSDSNAMTNETLSIHPANVQLTNLT